MSLKFQPHNVLSNVNKTESFFSRVDRKKKKKIFYSSLEFKFFNCFEHFRNKNDFLITQMWFFSLLSFPFDMHAHTLRVISHFLHAYHSVWYCQEVFNNLRSILRQYFDIYATLIMTSLQKKSRHVCPRVISKLSGAIEPLDPFENILSICDTLLVLGSFG